MLYRLFLVFFVLILFDSCKQDEPKVSTVISPVLIVNEGNFNWGNSSISSYNRETEQVQSDIYFDVNGVKLGDVAQSLSQKDSLLFVIVNNSSKIEVVSKFTLKRKWTISLPNSSPRYFLAINDSLGLVSELYANKLWIVNYINGSIKKTIPMQGETQQMIMKNGTVFVLERTVFQGQEVANIVLIDPVSLTRKGVISLPSAPNAFTFLTENILAVSTDFKNSMLPSKILFCDVVSKSIIKSFDAPNSERFSYLRSNANGTLFYMLNKNLYTIENSSNLLSTLPLISHGTSNVYALDIDFSLKEIYISDALDYVQRSKIMRYSFDGRLIDEFNAGINSTQIYFVR
jgi:hypothetical protein